MKRGYGAYCSVQSANAAGEMTFGLKSTTRVVIPGAVGGRSVVGKIAPA